MSGHPPILDTALECARQAGVELTEAYDGFVEAARHVEGLDGWLGMAVESINTTTGLIERHTACYVSAQDLIEQAIQRHISQRYGSGNGRAARAEARMKRGMENIGPEKEALLNMGQALTGAAEQFTGLRGSVSEAKDTLEKGAVACGILAVGQRTVIEGIQKYITTRDQETGVGKNVEGQFTIADEVVQRATHTQEPAELAQNIADSAAPLGDHRETLEQVKQAIEQIHGILYGMDQALTYWSGYAHMPDELPGLHAELARLAGVLNLPLTAEMLNDHIRRLTLQRKNFEAAQTAVDENRDYITGATKYIAQAVSALTRYLRRGY